MELPPDPWGGCLSDCSHCQRLFSCIRIKTLAVKLAHIAPCVLSVAAYEDRESILYVVSLQVAETYVEVCSEPSPG